MITFTQLQRPSDTHAHSPALHLKELVSFQQHRRLAFGMKDVLQAFSFFFSFIEGGGAKWNLVPQGHCKGTTVVLK